jgi:hypothetical protein
MGDKSPQSADDTKSLADLIDELRGVPRDLLWESFGGPIEVTVKQVSEAKLDDFGRRVLDYCFGGHRWGGGEESGRAPIVKRFSGHPPLPAGFYYTLVKDSYGDDDGTLAQELKAYAAHGSEQEGYFEFWDFTVPQQRAEGLDILRMTTRGSFPAELDGPWLVVALLPTNDQPHPLARDYTSKPVAVHVCIPLSIERLRFGCAIDLRDPETARRFTYNMTRLPFFPHNPPLDSFRDLLPTILRQNLGGTHGVLSAMGSALRNMGVQALIYPSARTDCYIEAEEGKVQRWGGWNLVRYARASAPEVSQYIDSDHWMTHIGNYGDAQGELTMDYSGVEIEFQEQTRTAGSWRVRGLSVWQDAFFEGSFIGPLAKLIGVRDEIGVVIQSLLPGMRSGEAWLQLMRNLKYAALGSDQAKVWVRDCAERFNALNLTQTADILRNYIRCCP